jgi:hypothetical protein
MAIAFGFVLGLILGVGSGTGAGAFAGAVIGISVGLAVYAFGWVRAHTGNAPTLERHRMICTPSGTFAECELLGDLERRRWVDVRRCSLQSPDAEPACEKSCLRLMNDAGVRPGKA